jgi:MFS family permease
MVELGAILGALSCSYLADRISRKRTILFGCVWYLIGSALQTGAVNYAMLVVRAEPVFPLVPH